MTKKVVRPDLQPKKTVASSWMRFCKKHPDERSCAIFTRRHYFGDETVKCSLCGFQNPSVDLEQRTFKCIGCKKKIWLLSGTFFERVRRFLPWLAAIWFIEDGVVITAAEFARLVGVATSTALAIFKKLSVVVESRMQKDVEEIPSAMFIKTFFRRSRVTPAGKHPREEENVALMQSGQKPVKASSRNEIRSKQLPRPALSQKEVELFDKLICAREKHILAFLSETPISFDQLLAKMGLSVAEVSAAITHLELFEMIERLPGDRFVLSSFNQPDASECLELSSQGNVKKNIAARFIDFIARNFRGISRKYLQNYISLFWAYEDKKRWKKGALLEACAGFREVTDDDLLFYVTPLKVSAPVMLAA